MFKMRPSHTMSFPGVQCFQLAARLNADKNPDIKPDIEDECVPQPLSPISPEHRRGQGAWETCQGAISAAAFPSSLPALSSHRQN